MGNSFLIRKIPSSHEALAMVRVDLTEANIRASRHYQSESQVQGKPGTLKAGGQLTAKCFAGFIRTRKLFIRKKKK